MKEPIKLTVVFGHISNIQNRPIFTSMTQCGIKMSNGGTDSVFLSASVEAYRNCLRPECFIQ